MAKSGAALAGARAVHMNVFGLEPIRKFETVESQRRTLGAADCRQGEDVLLKPSS